jgi:biotin carboxylase
VIWTSATATYDSWVPRVLLVLPSATYRAPDFIDAAAKLGAELVVGSEHRQALSDSMGDRAVVLSLRQPLRAADQIERLAERSPLDAVVAVDDGGTRAAALASERLGLRGNALEAVERTRDKAAMRAAFAAAGVPQPEHRLVHLGDDVAEAAAALGPPVVVKPLTLSMSRGVIRADTPEEAAAVALRVRSVLADAGEDPAGRLLVERFVPGAEVAVEGMLRDGAFEPLAVFDKPDPLDGPFFEETIYVTPSRHASATLEAIEREAAHAAAALGLREGPVHAELRVDGDSVTVLELAARSIGGLCSRSLRFGLGVSLEELILRHALGLPLDGMRREDRAAGVMMLPIPRAGVLRRVGGLEEARAVPGIGGVEITVARGRPVRPLPEGDRYLGFVFAKGHTPEGVEATLREAHARLRVEIEPE